MVYEVLIVGCGNIAGRLDELQQSDLGPPLTHAKAYMQNEQFHVIGCIDPDGERRAAFQKYWGVENGYDTIEQVLRQGSKFDVVSVCSPTGFHLEHLEKILAISPGLVFCEKPVGVETGRATTLLEEYAQKNIPLIINYSRRFDESVKNFKADIASGRYGILRSGSGFYSKGILNNGSHLLDMLHFLLGDLIVDYVGIPVLDFKASDPTLPLVLHTSDDIPISLSPGNAKDYSMAELTLIFSKGQVTMMDGGLSWSFREVQESEVFAGYQVLKAPRFENGLYLYSLENAVVNIADVLAGRSAPLCAGEDGLKVLKLCSEILSRYSN